MRKITFALTAVMLVTVVCSIEVAFAGTGDFKVAYYNSNDSPNGGICPNTLRRVRDLKNCQSQKPKH
jgi:hypothetical protein